MPTSKRILFRTRALDRLVQELLEEIRRRFQPDQVILFLCHPELLEWFFPDICETSEPIGEGTWILPFPPESANELWSGSTRPYLLSAENIERIREYLPEAASAAKSGVIVPLSVHQILFGGLFLGSTDADRYRPRDGTDLLEQLGVKIALAMDNCLTYERVKYFSIRDPLTGLLNFFQIFTVLEREFRKARRTAAPLSILVIDLNFVHEMQEDFDSGSKVLKHAAEVFRRFCPKRKATSAGTEVTSSWWCSPTCPRKRLGRSCRFSAGQSAKRLSSRGMRPSSSRPSSAQAPSMKKPSAPRTSSMPPTANSTASRWASPKTDSPSAPAGQSPKTRTACPRHRSRLLPLPYRPLHGGPRLCRPCFVSLLTKKGCYVTQTMAFARHFKLQTFLSRATSSVDRALVSGTKGPGFDPRVALHVKSIFPLL